MRKMAHRILSVCIFCFICATHSPCASHGFVGNLDIYRHDGYKDPNIPKLVSNPQLNLRNFKNDYSPQIKNNDVGNKLKRSIDKGNLSASKDGETVFLKKIFSKYGDGNTMTIEGFETLLKRLDLLHLLSNKMQLHNKLELSYSDAQNEIATVDEHNDTCFEVESLKTLQQSTQNEPLNYTTFFKACPILLYSLLDESCPLNKNEVFEISDPTYPGISGLTWFYSVLAVFVISACGVGALVIIPVMQKKFYNPLMQFLVALAVGTLSGDALLHLLPHAMSSSSGHGHGHEHGNEGEDEHLENTWKGLVAMLGLIFFFIMERLILLINKWRKKKQKDKPLAHAHVKIYKDDGERRSSTQCIDKYNTLPYCYKDIMNDPHNTFLEPDNSAVELLGSKTDLQEKNSKTPNLEKLETNQNVSDALFISVPRIGTDILAHDHEDYTVIVREHGNDHHGHSHKHGHVHSAPQNYSSVAWMVIMGDGLHNFTDGMAIGAAFASGLAGGFSTTVAVFCHELPHEFGDFAMLLKAGMSFKQALFYNMLSSALCILGNLVGLYLGNTETANAWMFAVAAGTFIYIALVDMMPELSSAHDEEDNLLQSFLHLSGLLIGVGIMAIIALYEHDLKNLFHESNK